MISELSKLDNQAALRALETSGKLIEEITKNLAKQCTDKGAISVAKMDENQLISYGLAWITAEQRIAENFLRYAWDSSIGTSELEKMMAVTFAAEIVSHIRSELIAKPTEFTLTSEKIQSALFINEINSFIENSMKIGIYSAIAEKIVEKGHAGVYGLSDDHESFRETFRKFAEDVVKPHAEHVHRTDDIIPMDIINGLNEMGCFGLCIPESYGGIQSDEKSDNISMLVVTEELSRGSLGIAGSLITRPEIVSKALLKGGTEEQKQKWLGQLASGEIMCAVAVTEPNYGSDVAGMSVVASKVDGGWKINGVKTWCTFAGYAKLLLVLCLGTA